MDNFSIPEIITGRPINQISGSLDLTAPILFLARGRSGTGVLAKFLEKAGVYIGNSQEKNSLNATYDSLYWTFGFQRSLAPKLFKYGAGCLVKEEIVLPVALECLRRHLMFCSTTTWGFKTCAGMFSHSLYQYVFPRAKYIYLIRDGRDVILSRNGYFHLTNPYSRQQHWEYFKIITFGISNDIHTCPFKLPEKPHKYDEVMENRYWIQAKSWREHVCMMEHLKRTGQLSQNVYTIQYEKLCSDPVPVLEGLFDFLELKMDSKLEETSVQFFNTKSIGRWKQYKQYAVECKENMDAVFASMEPELELSGYKRV